MATSGYRDEWVTNYNTLRFSWSRSSYSIVDNTSTISWNLLLISGSYGAISSSASKSWSVTVNGTNYNGTTTVGIGNNTTKTLASGSTTIPHNADGTKNFSYSFSQTFGITFSGSYVGTVNGSSSETLDSIPRKAEITYAPDFTDEDTPTVSFNNPAGSSVTLKACISWTGGDDIAYRSLSWYEATNGYYTFNFTDEERDKLRNATLSGSTSRYVTMYITTFSSSGSLIDYSTKQVKFTVTDCAPELNPTVIDCGANSTILTGNPNTMIRSYNTLLAEFNTTAKKGASIVKKIVTCGDKMLEDDGYFEYVHDNVFTFTVTDNRGNSVSKTITIDAIDYIPITCNINYDTELTSDNIATINVTLFGNYFDGSFGAKNNNIDLQYIYRKSTEDFPKDENGNYIWNKIAKPSLTNNKYTSSFSINIDYKDTYIIKAWAADSIYNIYAKEQIIKIVPVFDWSESDFNFNVPVTIQGSEVQTARCFSAYCANVVINAVNAYGLTIVPIDTIGIQYGKSAFKFTENQIEIVDDNVHLIRAYASTELSGNTSYYMMITINGVYPNRPNAIFASPSIANNIDGYASMNTQILSVSKGDKIGISVGYSSPFTSTVYQAALTIEVLG